VRHWLHSKIHDHLRARDRRQTAVRLAMIARVRDQPVKAAPVSPQTEVVGLSRHDTKRNTYRNGSRQSVSDTVQTVWADSAVSFGKRQMRTRPRSSDLSVLRRRRAR
jgi:hypothetical protein